MSVAIDTIVYARRLRDAGSTERQAEGQAEALAAAMTDSLATKQDLRELETRMDARFGQIELRFSELETRMVLRFEQQSTAFDFKLESRISELEHRMTLRLGGMMVAGVGFMSALIKLA